MRRIYLLLIALALAWTAASAQASLNIGKLFDGSFRNDDKVVETVISGSALSGYNLKLYRSLTITGDASRADRIEPLVRADARAAIDREVINKQGRLYYGFYQLKPLSDSRRRYILYLNQFPAGGHKIILLYLEGKATPSQVKEMLK